MLSPSPASPQWHTAMPDIPEFSSLDAVFAIPGNSISSSYFTEVLRIEIGGIVYFVKRHHEGGKGLRKWLGMPRIVSEYLNLQRFSEWDIPVPRMVAWGYERKWGIFKRGALITAEIRNSQDLAEMARNKDGRFQDANWVHAISTNLATYTRTMHAHKFGHNDLQWRNLIVDDAGVLYFIDCPCGRFWEFPFLQYRIVKDLAGLDKIAKKTVSKTQRLRFYLDYRGIKKLAKSDKTRIARILKFYRGRGSN